MPVDASCEELLTAICTYCGWLRKERKTMKFFSWGKTYCVLSDRCFYYFKNEKSKKPKGKFPLYGFNKVKRNIDETVKWSFVLEHVQPNQKNYVFAASSQQEMVEWMKYIKEEMLRANNRGPRTIADGSSDSSGGNHKRDSLEKIEEKIYDDFTTFQPVNMPNSISSDSDSDDSSTDTHKEKPPKFQMQQRGAAEGRPNPRRGGYEHVDQPSQTDYWNSIYYTGDKDEATRIIEEIAKDGVFLVRDSDSSEITKVLVVYSQNQKRAKKFKIFMKKENSKTMYYMKTDFLFETVEELIYHYYHNSISTDEVFKLTEPYLLAKH